MNESYWDVEKLESFLKAYRAIKSECWMCAQIARKIEQKIIMGDNERYHMVTCPSIKQSQNKADKSSKEK